MLKKDKKERSRSRSKSNKQEKQEIPEGDFIESLKEQDNYLMQKYNDKMELQKKEEQDKKDLEQLVQRKEYMANRPTRAGGVYVPPHKLKELQQQLMDSERLGQEYQKLMWELPLFQHLDFFIDYFMDFTKF